VTDNPSAEIKQHAARIGSRVMLSGLAIAAAVWLLAALGSLLGLGTALERAFVRVDDCAGCRPLMGGTVARGGQPVARLTQAADGDGARRPLPMLLASGAGPSLDSAVAGHLVGVVDRDAIHSSAPVVELVAVDSTGPDRAIARLVVAGRGTIPVYELRGSSPP